MIERALTGIKPTGILHIGNYFGAIKPTIDFANSNQTLLFLADYHALNYIKTKQELQEYSFELACALLACGLDPEKVIYFKQSDIPEVFELTSILTNVTPKGLMNRAHAYKAMAEQNESNGEDKDLNVNMGLYVYPILMAADILLYNSKFVPVGEDQLQHVEIARDIAGSFNARYGETFILPEAIVSKEVGTIVGLDGRKMSKSYGNTIQLFAEENVLKKTIMKIVTDSKMPSEPKDPNCTIAQFYKLFASTEQFEQFKQKLASGIGYGDAKKELFEVANSFLAPMREKYNYYKNNKQEVLNILNAGAQKARAIAKDVLAKVRKAIGVDFYFNK